MQIIKTVQSLKDLPQYSTVYSRVFIGESICLVLLVHFFSVQMYCLTTLFKSNIIGVQINAFLCGPDERLLPLGGSPNIATCQRCSGKTGLTSISKKDSLELCCIVLSRCIWCYTR